MSASALAMSLILVLLSIVISAKQRLDLEREIVIGTIRAVIQLLGVGFILTYIFQLKDWRLTLAMLLVMVLVAGQNAAKRGKDIPGSFRVVIIAIGGGALITLSILVLLGIITFTPAQVIPIGGMIIGNSMVGAGLVLNRLAGEIKQKQDEIEAYLALGATSRQAAERIIRTAVKAGLIPTVDSMKTLGIVQLPGMMTGLILAGADPLLAVRYQILVAFMLSATVSISCVIVGLLAYRQFFTTHHQLRGAANNLGH